MSILNRLRKTARGEPLCAALYDGSSVTISATRAFRANPCHQGIRPHDWHRYRCTGKIRKVLKENTQPLVNDRLFRDNVFHLTDY